MKLIEDLIDEKYYQLEEKRVTDYLNKVFSGIEIKGIENIVDEDSNIIIVPTHRSELDQILVGYTMYKKKNKIMKFLGGKNLFIPGITTPLIGKTLLMDIRKIGVIAVDRKLITSNREYIKGFKKLLTNSDLNKYPIFVTIQDGRTKDGFVKEAETGLLKLVCNALKTSSKKTYIYPATIDYSRVFEDWTFKKNIKNKERFPPPIAGLLNALMDIYAIAKTPNKYEVEPKAYLTIGNPIVYDKKNNVKNIGAKIREKQIKNITITAPMIYFYAQDNKMNCKKLINMLQERNANLSNMACRNKNVIKYTQKLFDEKSNIQYYINYASQAIDNILYSK